PCAVRSSRRTPSGDRLGYCWLRYRELGSGFSHASPFCDAHQDVQIAQSQSASDTVVPGLDGAHEKTIMGSSDNRISWLWAAVLVWSTKNGWRANMLTRRAFGMMLVAISSGHGPCGRAMAQSYPARPIKLIVPILAGGPADAIARLVAQNLSAALNEPVIVDNRAGGGLTIGTRA